MALPYIGARVRAPEFPSDLEWLNAGRPLAMADLRGKVVLLDFWTFCCINCMHVLPDLKALERKYPRELAVVGVHSAKFSNERDADQIRQAVLRYEIEHPVVNDHELRLWQAYGVQAWPTLVVVDPDGYVYGATSGEGHLQDLDETVALLADRARRDGRLNEAPLALRPEREGAGATALAFPGKVLADEATGRLFIADSNHNRIVIADLEGQVQAVAGTGARGAADGPFDAATFHHPQGMALDGESLYVADTENHLIRRLDLRARAVETVAGTGRQARRPAEAGQGRAVDLNSPWDLARVDRELYIAMAGAHQIWVMNLGTAGLRPFAGTGREELLDGSREMGALAQPSGLATDGRSLYVADSEISAIRQIELGARGALRTLVGLDLFEFGDVDGAGSQVRLQHPLGVALAGGRLYVADTYNHKLKALDPEKGTCATLAGTGRPGFEDGAAGEAGFWEPGGISAAGGRLYVADTNNHAVRVVDPKTGEVTTLRLHGLMAPGVAAAPGAVDWMPAEEVEAPEAAVAPDAAGVLAIALDLPAGHHVNPEAPFTVQVGVEGDAVDVAEADRQRVAKAPALPLCLPFRAGPAGRRGRLTVDVTFYYCREDGRGLCLIQPVRWTVPLKTERGGAFEVRLTFAPPPADAAAPTA
ncbi:MAG TPA: thioredoxin-like domain-containing protein [Candidatus Sulfotelmatobacter sp.]|nr:thioredoxin-like domain-containing protein [Candidatus Sulfotelmatobacter sp.]